MCPSSTASPRVLRGMLCWVLEPAAACAKVPPLNRMSRKPESRAGSAASKAWLTSARRWAVVELRMRMRQTGGGAWMPPAGAC